MSQTQFMPKQAGFYPPPPLPKPLKRIPPWLVVSGVLLVVVAMLGASIGGVYLYRRGSQSALTIVAPLHAQMVKDDDAGIFRESDPAYQEQVGVVKSNQIFDLVRDRLGVPESSHVAGFNFSAESRAGAELTLTFITKFTKGTATETIKWRNINGRYKLLAYHIESPKLVESEIPQNLRS